MGIQGTHGTHGTHGRRGTEGAEGVEVSQTFLMAFLLVWLKRLRGGGEGMVSLLAKQKYILTTNKGDSLCLNSHLPQPRIHLVQNIPVNWHTTVS